MTGLQIYCINKEKHCQWKGDLIYLSTHLSKGNREGECQLEEVKCRYEKCQETMQRCVLDSHEKNECPHRAYQCQYCMIMGEHLFITTEHYEVCTEYPVSCPNLCRNDVKFPRSSIDSHLSNDCPLQPVECPFSWAGCTNKPLLEDRDLHATHFNHESLLAVTCGQLKRQLSKRPDHPVLPVTINKGPTPTHVYTHHPFGHHISVMYIDDKVYLAFHKGEFDIFQPVIPNICITFQCYIPPKIIRMPIFTGTGHETLDDDILLTDTSKPGVRCVNVTDCTLIAPISSLDIIATWDNPSDNMKI